MIALSNLEVLEYSAYREELAFDKRRDGSFTVTREKRKNMSIFAV